MLAGVETSEAANEQDLVFAEDAASAAKALAERLRPLVLKLGCLKSYGSGTAMGIVEADQPRLWFARAAKLLKPALSPGGVHSRPSLAPSSSWART
jgi:UDP-3-O-[3-hydroxymyristoyl] glucosamine N-acyltransferase